MQKSNKQSKSIVTEADIHITPADGNVFEDLGFPHDEAVNLLARSRLMSAIENTIRAHGWSQAKAAKMLGVTQPRVSDLFTGRIDKFTVDMLMKWLDKLGKKVTFSVEDKDPAAA